MTIEIIKTDDWNNLVNGRLTTVLDPMVIRCGELFLRGRSASGDPDSTWGLLDKNVHAIGMFFDQLVLNEKIPIFNYGDTFDAGLDLDKRVLGEINQLGGDILCEVDVTYDAYHQVKSVALEEVKTLYQGQACIEPTLAMSILSELSTSEYQWQPSLEEFGDELASDDERRLAAFFLGGLIFGGYAQLLSGQHVLQPKRSRLFLAAHLREKSSQFELEKQLFGKLKTYSQTHCEDLPWMPSFFPYLLSKADTPLGVLQEALALRNTEAVADYRQWIGVVLDDWEKNGHIGTDKKKDVDKVVEHIDRILGHKPTLPQFKLKVSVADVIKAKPPGEIDATSSINALWGWFLDSLPGNRYRKLLARALVDDNEYKILTKRLHTVWLAK
jgi:hypothetical protein